MALFFFFLALVSCSPASAGLVSYPVNGPLQFATVENGQSVFILSSKPGSNFLGLSKYDFEAGKITESMDEFNLNNLNWFAVNPQGTFAVVSVLESDEVESYFLWDVKNHKMSTLLKHTSNDPHIKMSPGGRYVYLLANPEEGMDFTYLDLSTGQQKVVYSPSLPGSWIIANFRFEGNSDEVSFVAVDGGKSRIVLFDPQKGVLLEEAIKTPSGVATYSFSDDRKSLLYSTGSEPNAILRDTVTKQEEIVRVGSHAMFFGNEWLMEAGTLLHAYNLQSKVQRELEVTQGYQQGQRLFSIDAKSLALCEYRGFSCDSLRVFKTKDFSTEQTIDLAHLPGVRTVYANTLKTRAAVAIRVSKDVTEMQGAQVWTIDLNSKAERKVADISGVSMAAYIGGFCQISADESFMTCLDTDVTGKQGVLNRIDLR
ncbi:MAG: hypothetical protein ACXWQO_14915 [Bdellovibrionota bacterium]